ncbi:M-phase phosphoprotein 6 protein [Raphanus sativus]|nr:M-phase phosphoprotein 6 protein [Raphanus sativus]
MQQHSRPLTLFGAKGLSQFGQSFFLSETEPNIITITLDSICSSSPLRNRKSRVGICIGEEATTMAKREISSTLRNLKFMQRSAAKEEKKIDKEPNGSFSSLGSVVAKKCVVITDWDPQPGALLGRMSFQSFNPSIEKLNEEATSGRETDASVPTSSSSNGGRMSFRSVPPFDFIFRLLLNK